MATVNAVQVDLGNQSFGNNAILYTWTPLHNGDQTSNIPGPGWADRSLQITGTFGTGGQVTIEGSNDGINFFTLNDPFGVPLVVTAASIKQITEVTLFARARVTAGDGTTAITIIACLVNHAGLI